MQEFTQVKSPTHATFAEKTLLRKDNFCVTKRLTEVKRHFHVIVAEKALLIDWTTKN